MDTLPTRMLPFGPRRAVYVDVARDLAAPVLPDGTVEAFEAFDLAYRTLCGILYNYVPTSGHPGGSISSGRHVAGILFSGLDYDIGDPERPDADLLSYAAGHKALGLYAMWALRDEIARIGRPGLLPEDPRFRLRLEDLLGFRRNPTQNTPLFERRRARPLDGHPTPATPFVRLATGASGVGMGSSFGLAFAALDTWGGHAPYVHVAEGEGGMTPGRVAEAFALASAARLWNLRVHVDWNQASIDSDRVCREGDRPGDYVQWDPVEFAYLHDWNVVFVEQGHDVRQVLAALEWTRARRNDQPTAVVYRTTKGWRYGIEGRRSHGAGHGFCSPGFHTSLEPFERRFGVAFPRYDGPPDPIAVEQAFWDTLGVLREALEGERALCTCFADRLAQARTRLEAAGRTRRPGCPDLARVYAGGVRPDEIPPSCTYAAGAQVTLRGALGDTLHHLNRISGGGFVGASADLLESTSLSHLAKGFPAGFFDAVSNPGSRLVACGGICEDAMGAFLSGVASYGTHVGAGSSYGAFIAALEHVAARLHGIGQQARRDLTGEPFHPFLIVCGHAGLQTGEDGPTHADPQALQLLQENFPPGVLVTLTPWDPQELYPLTVAALQARPAVVAPFVTRPPETVLDREKLGIPPATAAVQGLYPLRRLPGGAPRHGTLVLQGSGVTNTFLAQVLPRIDAEGLKLEIFYVSSAELFDRLPADVQEQVFPEALASEAMGITDFTLSTMYRWIPSRAGRARTLHPFRTGRFPGSGQAHKVAEEAGLHGEGQWRAVRDYARRRG
ncbi:MAG: hypothetical protein JXB39_03325 [Deltaproteobacteria bacterium]|nr:hypothetical protein [Deltaproteobacteria bacterium]